MKIEKLLLDIDVSPKLKGFSYIVKAQELIAADPTIDIMQIYSLISEIYNSSPCAIERSIRYARIGINEDKWRSLGGRNKNNSDFLFTLSLILGLNQEV